MEVTRTLSLISLTLLLLTHPSLAAAPRDTPAQANALYEQGHFEEARDQYLALVQQGWEGVDLYGNLGNAYFRLGQRGQARLWYERARQLDNANEDVKNNIQRIQELADEKAPLESNPFGSHARSLSAWAVLAAHTVFVGLWLLGMRWSSEILWWGRVGAATLLALALGAAVLVWNQPGVLGVVTSPHAEARTGPSMDQTAAFTVPEGHAVMLFDRWGSWRQVGLPDRGLKGWMSEDQVEMVPLEKSKGDFYVK